MLALRLAAGLSALGCLLAAGVLDLMLQGAGDDGISGSAGADTAFKFFHTTDLRGNPIDDRGRRLIRDQLPHGLEVML